MCTEDENSSTSSKSKNESTTSSKSKPTRNPTSSKQNDGSTGTISQNQKSMESTKSEIQCNIQAKGHDNMLSKCSTLTGDSSACHDEYRLTDLNVQSTQYPLDTILPESQTQPNSISEVMPMEVSADPVTAGADDKFQLPKPLEESFQRNRSKRPKTKHIDQNDLRQERQRPAAPDTHPTVRDPEHHQHRRPTRPEVAGASSTAGTIDPDIALYFPNPDIMKQRKLGKIHAKDLQILLSYSKPQTRLSLKHYHSVWFVIDSLDESQFQIIEKVLRHRREYCSREFGEPQKHNVQLVLSGVSSEDLPEPIRSLHTDIIRTDNDWKNLVARIVHYTRRPK